jgi:hypothetical protein
MSWFCPAFWWRDSNRHLVFSVFPPKPTSLLASIKFAFFFILSMLSSRKRYLGLVWGRKLFGSLTETHNVLWYHEPTGKCPWWKIYTAIWGRVFAIPGVYINVTSLGYFSDSLHTPRYHGYWKYNHGVNVFFWRKEIKSDSTLAHAYNSRTNSLSGPRHSSGG